MKYAEVLMMSIVLSVKCFISHYHEVLAMGIILVDMNIYE